MNKVSEAVKSYGLDMKSCTVRLRDSLGESRIKNQHWLSLSSKTNLASVT
ncbi:hypothetical protein [cyanobacterium endosymbiont of Rhopalodia gibberula]|nr:hypothetical protein [cyanobacterium endosymbiont of Rhopalodia gibberula]